jgi:hypothetical protein
MKDVRRGISRPFHQRVKHLIRCLSGYRSIVVVDRLGLFIATAGAARLLLLLFSIRVVLLLLWRFYLCGHVCLRRWCSTF